MTPTQAQTRTATPQPLADDLARLLGSIEVGLLSLREDLSQRHPPGTDPDTERRRLLSGLDSLLLCTAAARHLVRRGRPSESADSPREASLERQAEALRPRVLVIDDDVAVARSLKRSLSLRYETVVARDANDAIDLLANGTWHAVLAEVDLANTSLQQILRWVRSNRPELVDRFAIVTAGAHNPDQQTFLSTTCMPVLHKPPSSLDLNALVATIVSWPAGRERRRSPRFRAPGARGQTRLSQRPVPLVDYSRTGIRVDGRLVSDIGDRPIEIVLQRDDLGGEVRALAALVREHVHPGGRVDQCFTFVDFFPGSLETLSAWQASDGALA